MLHRSKVFVVDDDPEIRRSFEWLAGSIDLAVETFGSASEFLDSVEPDQPGCLVLDVRMAGMGGLELQSVMQEHGYSLPVIMVTGYGDVPTAVRAMKRGAAEFVEKPYNDQFMLDRIQDCLEKDNQVRDALERRSKMRARIDRLTRREKQVLELISNGLSNKQAAHELGISARTVEVHRANAMTKLEVRTVAEMVKVLEQSRSPAELY